MDEVKSCLIISIGTMNFTFNKIIKWQVEEKLINDDIVRTYLFFADFISISETIIFLQLTKTKLLLNKMVFISLSFKRAY